MTNKTISALTAATTPLAGTEIIPLVQSGATAKVAATEVAATLVKTNASFGVAVALSTWSLGTVTEWGTAGNFILANGNNNMSIGTGAYYNAGWKYADNGYASRYQQTGGEHWFQSATLNASGPGAAVAMTTRWKIDVNFNLKPMVSGYGIDFTANTPAAGMTSQLLNWYEEGTWTPSRTGFTEVLGAGSITATGRYIRIGKSVTIQITLACAGGATIAATAGIGSYFGGLPFTPAVLSSGTWVDGSSIAADGGFLVHTNTNLYMTTGWTAAPNVWYFSATYFV